jgi:hypothetical protein
MVKKNSHSIEWLFFYLVQQKVDDKVKQFNNELS